MNLRRAQPPAAADPYQLASRIAMREGADKARGIHAANREQWEAFLQLMISEFYRLRFDELSDATPTWQTRKFARMEQTRNVIALLVKRDTSTVQFWLDHGMEFTMTSKPPCMAVNDGPPVGPPYDYRLVYADGRRIPIEVRLDELRETHEDHR